MFHPRNRSIGDVCSTGKSASYIGNPKRQNASPDNDRLEKDLSRLGVTIEGIRWRIYLQFRRTPLFEEMWSWDGPSSRTGSL